MISTKPGSLDAPMPLVASVVTGLVLLLVGLLLCWMALRSAKGSLKRNPWAGIRIPSTMASEAAWDAGHRAAVLPMMVAGVGPAAVGALLLTRPSGGTALTVIALSSFWLVGWLVVATVLASRSARALGAPPDDEG